MATFGDFFEDEDELSALLDSAEANANTTQEMQFIEEMQLTLEEDGLEGRCSEAQAEWIKRLGKEEE